MTKELIKQLRFGAAISRDRGLTLDFARIADKAADAIERLKLEQEREIVTMRERIKSLKRCIGDFEGTTRENIELRAELEKIKQSDEQAVFEEWIGRVKPYGDVESIQRQWEQSSDLADFLAPGAQPVHYLEQAMPMSNFQCKCGRAYGFPQPVPMTNLERMQAANSRGLIESVGLWEAFEFGISDAEAHHKIKAMLEAAKP